MTRQELKNQTEKIIENLPKESNWEDLMYRIYVRQKIELGIADGKAGRVRTTEEIRKEFNSF